MCGSMVDIQSVTVEIRRGKKKKEDSKKKKPQGENIMSASDMQGGHKNVTKGVMRNNEIYLVDLHT